MIFKKNMVMKFYKIVSVVLIFAGSLAYSKHWFNIASVKDVVEKNRSILYQSCLHDVPFSFEPFLPDSSMPHEGACKKCFILTIPNGRVQSAYGFTLINNVFIREMIRSGSELMAVKKIDERRIVKKAGRGAVLAQLFEDNYFHWIIEVLGRLALLEMHHVAYDWLYVKNDKPFMKETLQLWGVNPAKTVFLKNAFCGIQAEQLILPSLVSDFVMNVSPTVLNYVKNKLLTAVLMGGSSCSFSKKVFVSRSDTSRKIGNEQDIFNALQQYGFEKYELGTMSVKDQIVLFHNAEIVVAEHGAGLTNILFCNRDTKIVEIFQTLKCNCYWYLAHALGLSYRAVKTVEFQNGMQVYKSNICISQDAIEKIVEAAQY